jgi:hypothetical protein
VKAREIGTCPDSGPGTGISLVLLDEIKPSPENDKLYRPVSADDPAIVALATSIAQIGVGEPLVLSVDGYIISGHRRFVAARLAGLLVVPVLYADVRHDEDPDRFLVLLREHNRQRVKGFDEQVREAAIDADPEESRRELIEHRRERAKTRHVPIRLPEAKHRAEISAAKVPLVKAILHVMRDLKDFLPLTIRQIHYQLLNDPPLRHASKPDSGYRNDIASYKSADELLTRMRLVDADHWAHIPDEDITDETRPVTIWNVHPNVATYVTRELEAFLKGYYRDLMRSQPNHIEILVEKNTVAGIIRPISADYTIPMTSGRGYSSLPPRAEMARRFAKSGKEKLVVIMVSDFDPEGENIASSFARSMRDDFGVVKIEAIKAALTDRQVKQLNLPPQFEVKEKSSRAKGFIAKHGKNVWELEALPPRKLQELVRACVLGALDIDALNREQRAEEEDARGLHGMRVTVQEALRGYTGEHSDEDGDDGEREREAADEDEDESTND